MEKRTTQSIPFHEGHEHLRKVNRSIRPAFGSRNNVSGCFLSVALEAFSITTDWFLLRGLPEVPGNDPRNELLKPATLARKRSLVAEMKT